MPTPKPKATATLKPKATATPKPALPKPTTPPTAALPAATPPPTAVLPGAQPTATQSNSQVYRPASCGTSLQTHINATPRGHTLDLRGCTFQGVVNVTKPMTIVGPKLIAPTSSPWSIAISIDSDGVTLDGWKVEGGGLVVSVFGRSNVQILNSSFSGQIGATIALWGKDGRGSNNVTIAGNTITQTKTTKTSPIIARASEDCSLYSHGLVIRNNVMDQGQGDIGWFGTELKCQEDVLIEGNRFSGGKVLVSLPDTNNVMIRSNTFDMTGSPVWGVEVANADNVTITRNTFFGDGPNGNDHAVSINSGSKNTRMEGNNVEGVRTAIDTTGHYVTVKDNCLSDVQYVTEYQEAGPFVESEIENNGPCT